MRAEDLFGNTLMRHIGGVIISHGEFFENHVSLDFEFLGVEHRIRHHVGEHLNSHGEIVILNLGVIAGVFFRGQGVVFPTHRIKGHGDIEGASCAGALEQQVF